MAYRRRRRMRHGQGLFSIGIKALGKAKELGTKEGMKKVAKFQTQEGIKKLASNYDRKATAH